MNETRSPIQDSATTDNTAQPHTSQSDVISARSSTVDNQSDKQSISSEQQTQKDGTIETPANSTSPQLTDSTVQKDAEQQQEQQEKERNTGNTPEEGENENQTAAASRTPQRRVSSRPNKGIKKHIESDDDTHTKRTVRRRTSSSLPGASTAIKSGASSSSSPSASPATSTTVAPSPEDVTLEFPRSIPAGFKLGDEGLCTNCFTTESPQWRHGPKGHKTLCNACGLRHSKGTITLDRDGKEAETSSPLKSHQEEGKSKQGANQQSTSVMQRRVGDDNLVEVRKSDEKTLSKEEDRHVSQPVAVKVNEESSSSVHDQQNVSSSEITSNDDDYLMHPGIAGADFDDLSQMAVLVGPGADAIEPLGPVTPEMKRVEFKKKGKVCTNCGVPTTPCWRKGPLGSGTLCNACGLKFKNSNLILNPYTGATTDKTFEQIFVRPSKHEYDPTIKKRSKTSDRSRARRSTSKKSRSRTSDASTRRERMREKQLRDFDIEEQQQQQARLSPNPMLAEHMRFGVSFTKQKRERKKPKYFTHSSDEDDQSMHSTPRRISSRRTDALAYQSESSNVELSPEMAATGSEAFDVDYVDQQKSVRTYVRKRKSLSKGVTTIVGRDGTISEKCASSSRQVQEDVLMGTTLRRTLAANELSETVATSGLLYETTSVDGSGIAMDVDQTTDHESTVGTPLSSAGAHSPFAYRSTHSSMKRRRGRPPGSKNRSREELDRIARTPRIRRKRGRPPKNEHSSGYADYGDYMILGVDGSGYGDSFYDDEYSWYSDSSIYSDDGISQRKRKRGSIESHSFRIPQPSASLVCVLPAKQIVNIMSFLDARSLSMCSMVCYKWRLMAFKPILWQQLYERVFSIDYDSLAKYSGFIDWRQLYVARRHIKLFSPIEQAEFMCKFYAVENNPKFLECIMYRAETELRGWEQGAHRQASTVSEANRLDVEQKENTSKPDA